MAIAFQERMAPRSYNTVFTDFIFLRQVAQLETHELVRQSAGVYISSGVFTQSEAMLLFFESEKQFVRVITSNYSMRSG